ncbi:MAG: hypothetical protein RL695_1349 [Pseudomonadota bacterium]
MPDTLTHASADIPMAHCRQEETTLHPHPMDEHLCSTANVAASFAPPHGASWAHLAGLWHDLGKYRPGFQRYILQNNEASASDPVARADKTHSAAGALLALDRFGDAGRVLAYLIASHHAGLYDWHDLASRLQDDATRTELNEALQHAPVSIAHPDTDHADDLRQVPGGKAGFALWLRMLFSCLVDADFLDTEAFMSQRKASARSGYPAMSTLSERFQHHMAGKTAAAPATPVNTLRQTVLQQCTERAHGKPGIYTLTVPTGGGKTLSSLAFALTHAHQHGKRRIIYAIPYTSIVEQTADVFAEIFSAENIVEHHSQIEAEPGQETTRSRLACENWDAPLIVTTNVQLFESLFAAKTSRCRKLHNLIDSVIILDEAQCLPPEYLQPILDVLSLLTAHYGVTVVLCTATQPALASRRYFDAQRNRRGLDHVTEIIDQPNELFRQLDRVQVRLPQADAAPTPWHGLATELNQRDCVLVIVNTRKDARQLWHLLPPETLHLSALMCGAHRAAVITEIRQRLQDKREGRDARPLRVVSTQLVEAGVDIDFPVVYRAYAGLDSLAQAAGRCNREGLLERGELIAFNPPEAPPRGLIRQGADACRSVLSGHAESPLVPELFESYFDRLYFGLDLDKKGIVRDLTPGARLEIKFRTAAENFKLIDDEAQASVFVRWPEHPDIENIDMLLATLKKQGPEHWLMRQLQRSTVTATPTATQTQATCRAWTQNPATAWSPMSASSARCATSSAW